MAIWRTEPPRPHGLVYQLVNTRGVQHPSNVANVQKYDSDLAVTCDLAVT